MTRQARRTLLYPALIGISVLLAVYLLGCDGGNGDATTTATPTPSGNGDATTTATPTPGGNGDAAITATPTPSGPQHKELVTAWLRGQEVQYYDFGSSSTLTPDGTVATDSIWWFIHGVALSGIPEWVEGQLKVIDVVPGVAGYSDLFQVMFVTVTDDYTPDSIRSKAGIEASGFIVSTVYMYLNCPIVPEGSTLEGGEQLEQLWYRDEPVFCPNLGPTNPTPIPMWVFITGTDSQGNPEYLEGQNNIIDALPADPEYSSFCRVNLVEAPDDYEPNSIRSAEDVLDSGYPITTTDRIINCPVVTPS